MNLGKEILQYRSYFIDPEELLDDLLGELKFRNYSVTRVNNIDNVFQRDNTPAGSLNFKYYKIIEFCNLESCSHIISEALLSGVFMPARFLVYEEEKREGANLAFLKPTAFAEMFESKNLMKLAEIMEKDMVEISEELIG